MYVRKSQQLEGQARIEQPKGLTIGDRLPTEHDWDRGPTIIPMVHGEF